MSKKHVHSVTPHHKGNSGFFNEDGKDTNSAGAVLSQPVPKAESVRDLMGGIYEEDDEADEEKMYAHELPPDPFMQKLTIQEDEEEEEDEDYNSDFMEDSTTSVNSGAQQQQQQQLVSPISTSISTSAIASPSKQTKSTASILKDANSNLDSLLDKVNTVTSTLPTSLSVPALTTTSPPHFPLNKPLSPSKQGNSPRVTMRSPRSHSGSMSSRQNKSAQKLRQSPIRVKPPDLHVEIDSQQISTPKKQHVTLQVPAKSPEPYQHDEDFDFDFEDDFGEEMNDNVPLSEQKMEGEGGQSGAEGKVEGQDDDELFETFNPLKEVNTEGEQSSNLIEGKLEGRVCCVTDVVYCAMF